MKFDKKFPQEKEDTAHIFQTLKENSKLGELDLAQTKEQAEKISEKSVKVEEPKPELSADFKKELEAAKEKKLPPTNDANIGKKEEDGENNKDRS